MMTFESAAGSEYGHVPGHHYLDVHCVLRDRGGAGWSCELTAVRGSAQGGRDEEHGRDIVRGAGDDMDSAVRAALAAARDAEWTDVAIRYAHTATAAAAEAAAEGGARCALDEVIGPDLIARAARLGACRAALAWLRAAPRTWRELSAQHAGWLAWGVARDLADSVLTELVRDPDALVRRAVARLIAPEHLPEMMRDSDATVRGHVARRIDPAHLPELVSDSDAAVRWHVAARIDPAHLPAMVRDPDASVRRAVAERVAAASLPEMMADPSALVRWCVALRIDPAHLPAMMSDHSVDVRRAVAQRLGGGS